MGLAAEARTTEVGLQGHLQSAGQCVFHEHPNDLLVFSHVRSQSQLDNL
jgi:hypothetical protein